MEFSSAVFKKRNHLFQNGPGFRIGLCLNNDQLHLHHIPTLESGAQHSWQSNVSKFGGFSRCIVLFLNINLIQRLPVCKHSKSICREGRLQTQQWVPSTSREWSGMNFYGMKLCPGQGGPGMQPIYQDPVSFTCSRLIQKAWIYYQMQFFQAIHWLGAWQMGGNGVLTVIHGFIWNV